MIPGTALAAASLDSQLGFTWESLSPAQVPTISDCSISQAGWPRKNTGGGSPWLVKPLGLYQLGNPRTCVPSGQLQTTSEHHHPAPAQLILHEGWRLVVSSYSQSLQLSGLGKSLPLTCQQQPRLNYKRKVYSTHTKGTPRIPSLGDRRGCATGPYRTSITLGHATKRGSHSSST